MLTCVSDDDNGLTKSALHGLVCTFTAVKFGILTKSTQSSGSSEGLARIPSIEPHEGEGSPATSQEGVWTRRPFVMTTSHLLYFQDRAHLSRWAKREAGVEPRGSLPLQQLTSVEDGDAQANPPESRCAMTVRGEDGTAWVLRSADREEIAGWRALLSEAIGKTEEEREACFAMETFEV